jgi:hypothetical protein
MTDGERNGHLVEYIHDMGKKASQPRLVRGLVPDIYTLPVPEQLDRVRGLVEILDHECEMLVRSFEMLVPAATDADLIARFRMTEGSWGFGLIRMQLIERCVLSIYKLLADGDDTNPSLLTLVRPFLRGNRERYAELLEILRSDYSDWHKTISEQERRTRPAWEIAMFEQAGEEDAKKARAEFDQRAEAVAADWPKLEYDPVTKKYNTVSLPSVNEVYGTIARVVPIITDSAMHLLGLFRNLSIDPEEVRNLLSATRLLFGDSLELPRPGSKTRCLTPKNQWNPSIPPTLTGPIFPNRSRTTKPKSNSTGSLTNAWLPYSLSFATEKGAQVLSLHDSGMFFRIR